MSQVLNYIRMRWRLNQVEQGTVKIMSQVRRAPSPQVASDVKWRHYECVSRLYWESRKLLY